jgi:hypothetical protein
VLGVHLGAGGRRFESARPDNSAGRTLCTSEGTLEVPRDAVRITCDLAERPAVSVVATLISVSMLALAVVNVDGVRRPPSPT